MGVGLLLGLNMLLPDACYHALLANSFSTFYRPQHAMALLIFY